MELFVSYQSPKHEEVAFNLAKEFGLSCLFQGDIDKKENNESYFFVYKPDRSYIQRGSGNLSKDIYAPVLSPCILQKGLNVGKDGTERWIGRYT